MGSLLNATLTSWKTTASGAVAFLAVFFDQIKTLFDEDVATNPDWNLIVAAAAILAGLLFSRDNNVSSEVAGAKKGTE